MNEEELKRKAYEEYLDKAKKIHFFRDMLEGDINRISITDSLAEYGNMGISAKKHLDALIDMAYETLMYRLAQKVESEDKE